jgi:hypothetical protein
LTTAHSSHAESDDFDHNAFQFPALQKLMILNKTQFRHAESGNFDRDTFQPGGKNVQKAPKIEKNQKKGGFVVLNK